MSLLSPTATMIGLDGLMVAYTLWGLTIRRPLGKLGWLIAAALFGWLGVLHGGLENQVLFPRDISGAAFLAVIVAAVGAWGAVLLLVPPVRRQLLGLDQEQLMVLQGIRVFFGATFLLHASVGVLPQAFGIVDGFTHIGAGFFGLVAAFSMAAGIRGERRAWFANLFGMADILAVATSLALVLLPKIGPHHPMMYAVFLPAPLWVWFHVVSIAKLLRPGSLAFRATGIPER